MISLPDLAAGLGDIVRINVHDYVAEASEANPGPAPPGRYTLGEHPIWDVDGNQLLWVDIKGNAVHGWVLSQRTMWTVPATAPSLVWPCQSGRFLLATSAGTAIHHRTRDHIPDLVTPPVVTGRPKSMPATHRFNDGGCAPDGSLWISSMDAQGDSGGALYRISLSESGIFHEELMLSDVGCGNGIGWSPDGSACYFVESISRAIYRFGVIDGKLGRGELFAAFNEDGPLPDGLVVNETGDIWVAFWDGSCLIRFFPDGMIAEVQKLGASRPTCPGFGQPGTRQLFITSARNMDSPTGVQDRLSLGDHAGMIYGLVVETEGLPITTFNDGALL